GGRPCAARTAPERAPQLALGALPWLLCERDRARGPRRRRACAADELAAGAAYGQPHLPRPRRPGAKRLAGRVGRPRDAPRPAPPVQLQRLLPAPAEPRLLRLAARLRPRRVLRLGHRGRARPLQPAVPVRLVAVLRGRLSARPRA